MSGWRDVDGRTASERRQHAGDVERTRLLDTLRHRPLSLVKPALAGVFVLLLIAALLNYFM
ncbi:hypothetical protein [Terricaulis sp.]|uniref:hypothetical protein n=1 Tax=Terricaulis sp. TaxID=2768686 RepID=UPI0037850BDC